MATSKEGKCCFCGKEYTNYGNDPWPVKTKGRCCDKCNYEIVVKERFKRYQEERAGIND